ncbi:DUF1775 domain-containing protein [Micromonospora sp. NPDC047134]|uniref:DUF1775 domain-containing protein n=1 Tax=Micromonospora sp. NPDC047134 TaxID=3154340 RepID=UPI0033C151A1
MARTCGGGRRRRGGPVAVLVTALVLLWPTAAWADGVSFTPTEAQQGNSVKMEFTVPDERPGVRTERIEIRMPVDPPIAEVYPLSVPGWAPTITPRRLQVPVAGLHGPPTDVVTAALTWTRAPGPAEAGPARLAFSMAPLPQAEQVTFELTQTYADGIQVHWGAGPGQRPLPPLTLTPGDPAYPAHGGHGAAPTAGSAAPGDTGPNANSLLAAGLVAGLGGGAVVGWLISRRRRGDTIDRSVLSEDPAAPAAEREGPEQATAPAAEREQPARAGH